MNEINCVQSFCASPDFKFWRVRTSLVVQWLRIYFAMQGKQVQFLIGKLRSHMPHSDWAHVPQPWSPCITTAESTSCNARSHMLPLRPDIAKLKKVSGECSLGRIWSLEETTLSDHPAKIITRWLIKGKGSHGYWMGKNPTQIWCPLHLQSHASPWGNQACLKMLHHPPSQTLKPPLRTHLWFPYIKSRFFNLAYNAPSITTFPHLQLYNPSGKNNSAPPKESHFTSYLLEFAHSSHCL